MTMTLEAFRAAFESRTLAYAGPLREDTRPVVVIVGADAHTPVGHALLTALTNQLARAHRRLLFVGDLDRPLLCRDVFGHTTLADATIGLARAINPAIDGDHAASVPSEVLISLGVGAGDAELSLGADGWCAVLGRGARLDDGPSANWGALYAACLGAGAAFHRLRGVVGDPTGRYSLWRPGHTDVGPAFAGPIDIGRVLQVGAGAVGAGLDYFLALIGLRGAWRIVDGDVVDVSNLNRQLLFLARDAGYPEGAAVAKAIHAAKLIGPVAVGHSAFYDTDLIAQNEAFDVVLALANDRGVRGRLQHRQPTVLLHATTGRAWEAYVHRHIAGRDDCIVCRLPEDVIVRFTCSEEEMQLGAQRIDAAVPFLSATAALLLAAALAKLQLGSLADGAQNLWSVNLEQPVPWLQSLRYECAAGCTTRLPFAARQRIDGSSRFAFLEGDPEVGVLGLGR